MDMALTVIVVYSLCGLFAAFEFRKFGANKLMFFSAGFVLFTALASLGLINDGEALNNPYFVFGGQCLAVFYSIIGGAMFSTGWKESRDNLLNK